jgi:hypothetical protein
LFSFEQEALAIEVEHDELEVVVGKSKRVENTGRAELGVALQQRLDGSALPVPGEKPPHRHARPPNDRTSVVTDDDVRVGDANRRRFGHGDRECTTAAYGHALLIE